MTMKEQNWLAFILHHKKKIDLLIQILTNKSDWWDDWLWCLIESSATEDALSTHRTLAELLEGALEQQLKEYKV